MNILYIDTAMNACCVGVYNAAQNIHIQREEHRMRGQAERLLPLIEDAMQDAQLTPKQLNMIGVTIGPGTFTGLRVGMATARGLKLALSIDVIGVTTLDVIIHAHMADAKAKGFKYCAALVETKRSDYYLQINDVITGEILLPACALEGAEIIALCTEYQLAGQMMMVGDAIERLISEQGAVQDLSTHHLTCPDPKAGINLIQQHANMAKNKGDDEDIQPLYLRAADVSAAKVVRYIQE